MNTVRELIDSGKAYDMMVDALLKGELARAGNLSVIVSMQAQERQVDRFLPGELTIDKVNRLIDSRAMITIAKFVGDICADAVLDALDADEEDPNAPQSMEDRRAEMSYLNTRSDAK